MVTFFYTQICTYKQYNSSHKCFLSFLPTYLYVGCLERILVGEGRMVLKIRPEIVELGRLDI